MPTQSSFDYAIVRLVPRVDRGEFINAGVVLFCRTRRFLGAQIELNESRLLALAPSIELDEIRRHLETIPLICAGGPQAGPIGQLPQADRFHWLIAPRSAMIQASPVHVGLCADPHDALKRLVAMMVRSE